MSQSRSRSTCSRTRRSATAGLLALALAGGGLALAAPAGATPNPISLRIDGANRFATSAAISSVTWNDPGVPGAEAAGVVIASGLDYPDGLAASALAGQVGGPVLLVPPSGPLPTETVEEIERLGVLSATIVGGTAAVGTDVEAQLAGLGLTVERVRGANRFLTAAAVANEVIAGGVGTLGGEPTAFLATGANFADALAASAPAFAGSHPILLTSPDQLSQAAADVLSTGEITQVVLLGGTAAVSADVEADLDALDIGVVRVAGSNRFETATDLADIITASPDFDFDNEAVTIATGLNFADALSSGPFAGVNGTPLLFAEGVATQAYLDDNDETVAALAIIGGTGAVSEALEDSLVEAATTDAADTQAPAFVSATPAAAADDVAVDADLTATFDEIVAETSTATVAVSGTGGAAVTGTTSVSGNTITFDPAADLTAATSYTATFTARDAAGNASTATVTFSTAAAPVTPGPVLANSNVATGNAGVGVSPRATFEGPIEQTGSTAALTGPDGAVAGTVEFPSTRAVEFVPAAPLEYATEYTFTYSASNAEGGVTTGTVVFTTVNRPADPEFVGANVNPDDAATVDVNPTATYTGRLSDGSTATLEGPDGAVAGDPAVVDQTIVFTPDAPLTPETEYTVTFTAVDVDGLATQEVITFTTAPAAP